MLTTNKQDEADQACAAFLERTWQEGAGGSADALKRAMTDQLPKLTAQERLGFIEFTQAYARMLAAPGNNQPHPRIAK